MTTEMQRRKSIYLTLNLNERINWKTAIIGKTNRMQAAIQMSYEVDGNGNHFHKGLTSTDQPFFMAQEFNYQHNRHKHLRR